MIKRFLLGVAVGGAAIWFLDPGAGAARRRRARRAVALARPVARRAGGLVMRASQRAVDPAAADPPRSSGG